MKFKKWIRFGKQGNRKPVKHIYLYNVYAEKEGPIIATAEVSFCQMPSSGREILHQGFLGFCARIIYEKILSTSLFTKSDGDC